MDNWGIMGRTVIKKIVGMRWKQMKLTKRIKEKRADELNLSIIQPLQLQHILRETLLLTA